MLHLKLPFRLLESEELTAMDSAQKARDPGDLQLCCAGCWDWGNNPESCRQHSALTVHELLDLFVTCGRIVISDGILHLHNEAETSRMASRPTA